MNRDITTVILPLCMVTCMATMPEQQLMMLLDSTIIAIVIHSTVMDHSTNTTLHLVMECVL